jgi:TPP-dependent pyruvate/acetoin dehydrogenase alpha subunit
LSSRDKEVVKQVEEMERLKALTTRLKEQQNAKQDRIDSMVAEHSAEVKTLQEQLQQAYRANSCKEVCITVLISVSNMHEAVQGWAPDGKGRSGVNSLGHILTSISC